MTTRAAVVQGVGGCVPPRSVDNIELSSRLATSDAWIRERLGIARRHVADGMSTVDLAVEAGARALEMADTGAGVGELDVVLLATTTPDRLCPASAPEVASRLGYTGTAAFDVNAVCAGFVHALATGSALIRGHMADRVLVIGADVFTTLVDPGDRLTAAIFGDGAGALVLRVGTPDEPGAVRAFDLGSDGSQVAAVEVPAGGARDRLGMPVANQRPYLVMDGPAVFQRAVREMTESSRRVLAKAEWEADSVRRFVPHQANIRIIHRVAERLGIGAERVVANIQDVGNTVAASIPLALADAHDAGRLAAGQRVLLTSIGAGLAWGSAVLTWPKLEGKARL
ncbi:3-oxoacyl-[acyl-carrier-protein] synthase-3 [Catenulispora sp. GP43]|uniref:beta-ketoacyl-ACP synthase III n=1 Tax=Catenulispora sp. GP43 TaxID=3156263 RepID=UPI0035162D74